MTCCRIVIRPNWQFVACSDARFVTTERDPVVRGHLRLSMDCRIKSGNDDAVFLILRCER